MGEGFEFALHVSAIQISEKLRLSGEYIIANCINGGCHASCSFLLALSLSRVSPIIN
jgi:hypothetical protein